MKTWLPSRLIAATATAVLALTACGGSEGSARASDPPSASATTSPAPSPSAPGPEPSASATATPAGTGTPSTPGPGRTPAPDSAGLKPMWPFATTAQARAWEKQYGAGGHQPWHLDPEQTALSFTRDYLGFKDIDRVTSRTVTGRDARIGVGLSGTESTGTAAIIHLVRFGTGSDAPWEVVGTDDTDFSLTVPAYGSLVRSPLATGGRITGVDEGIRLQVLQPSSEKPLGTACCTSAGGTDDPWKSSVSFTGADDPVLTVVASTGGHVAEVERFTVTAVRTR